MEAIWRICSRSPPPYRPRRIKCAVSPPMEARKVAGENTYPGAFPREGRGWTLAGGGGGGAQRQAGAAQASGRRHVGGPSGSFVASGEQEPGADKKVFDQDT